MRLRRRVHREYCTLRVYPVCVPVLDISERALSGASSEISRTRHAFLCRRNCVADFSWGGARRAKTMQISCWRHIAVCLALVSSFALTGEPAVELKWVGKENVVNHHLDVPYHVLEKKWTFDATKSGEAESLPLHEEVKTSVSQAHPPTALVDFCVYANTAFCRNTWRYLKSERHGCGDAPMCSDALGAFLLPVFRLSHAKGSGRVQGKGRAFFCIGIPWRQVRAIGG